MLNCSFLSTPQRVDAVSESKFTVNINIFSKGNAECFARIQAPVLQHCRQESKGWSL